MCRVHALTHFLSPSLAFLFLLSLLSMPAKYGYGRRRRAPRRRLPEGRMTVSGRGQVSNWPYTQEDPLITAAKLIKKHGTKALKDFAQKARTRPAGRPMVRGAKGRLRVKGRVKTGKPIKHTQAGAASGKSAGDINHNNVAPKSRTGDGHGQGGQIIRTHPLHKMPAWKRKRHNDYKNKVWQTILISRPSRLPGSENILQKHRFPIKVPEAYEDSAGVPHVQTMMLQPMPSEWSGVHTTYYRCLNSNNTEGMDSSSFGVNGRFDVLQHKAPSNRRSFAAQTGQDGGYVNMPVYQHEGTTWDTAKAEANMINVFGHMDNLVREIDLNLEFTASRAFAVNVSISVVRWIQPTNRLGITPDDLKNLCNTLGKSRGLDYNRMVCEFEHRFTLPALQMNKKPPMVKFKKKLLCSWMQKSDFEDKTVSGIMTEASQNTLGSGIVLNKTQIPDGNEVGNFVVLIQYIKKRQVQQYTFEQTIAEAYNAAGYQGASVKLPAVSESSFNIPPNTGTGGDGQGGGSAVGDADGTPFKEDFADESKATFYLAGKVSTCFSYKDKVDQYPSLVSESAAAADKKPLSLNICPFVVNEAPITGAGGDTDSTGHNLYCRSVDHVEKA